jgi:hypothetical protein
MDAFESMFAKAKPTKREALLARLSSSPT